MVVWSNGPEPLLFAGLSVVAMAVIGRMVASIITPIIMPTSLLFIFFYPLLILLYDYYTYTDYINLSLYLRNMREIGKRTPLFLLYIPLWTRGECYLPTERRTETAKIKSLCRLRVLTMKIQTECVPCLLKRVLFETELSSRGKQHQTEALRAACSLLADLYDPTVCSARIATQVHQGVYHALHDDDPYRKLKKTSNDVALSLVPKVESLIKQSPDPLKTSLVCSIIGNIMDFGIEGSSTHPRLLEDVFDTLYEEGLGYDDSQKLRTLLQNATQCMVFTDNCGEIVFDKILCREMKRFNPQLHITAVVKGQPILSDATLQDAEMIHLADVVDEVMTTGCFAVGVDFPGLPADVLQELKDTGVIIAKGMANYESFSETSYRPIAYLLRTKCHAIAQSMQLPQNISAIKVYE
jgi:uncharacterized protein with ATP-grasp and redox domains